MYRLVALGVYHTGLPTHMVGIQYASAFGRGFLYAEAQEEGMKGGKTLTDFIS